MSIRHNVRVSVWRRSAFVPRGALSLTSNNLLYPEADRTNHVLMYACRNCPYRTEADNPMVYRNDLKAISKVRRTLTPGAAGCYR